FIRLIRGFINSSTYAFTFMISAFLLGLVFGTFIYSRKIISAEKFVQDPIKQLESLTFVQNLTALLAGLRFLCLPVLLIVWATVSAAVRDHSPIWALFAEGVAAGVIMLLPATTIGICLPVLCGVASRATKQIGNTVGSIYASNTVGCILGSLVTGMV